MATSRTASLVINTFNRARALERLLPSLARLEGVFEVVVVNGPSTDDTTQVLAAWAGRIKTASCPVANLSRSRNIGIAAAAGEIVVFIDDDALPADTRWLTRLLAPFDRRTGRAVGAAGGPALHRDTDWPEFAGGWTSDYGEQRFTDAPAPDGDGWVRRTVGNNSAFRRTALQAIGGFDERFRYYLDEADVCLRLVRAGYDVVYVPDAGVRHYPAPSPVGPPFIRNRRIIARSDTYYALKNGRHGWLRRLWTTLRLAPTKHFVTEVPQLVDDGRLTAAQARGIRAAWRRGVIEGLALGLFASRRFAVIGPAPSFLRLAAPASPRPLRVALLARRVPPDVQAGGVGRYTYDLARGLFERGHDVTVLTESTTAVCRVGQGFELHGVTAAPVPAGWSQVPVLAANVSYAQGVLDAVRARQTGPVPFDVVHATNWGLEAAGLAAWGGCPLSLALVTPLESVMAAEQWPASADLTANLRLDQAVIDRADRVTAPSARVAATYAARADWSAPEVHPVALGTVPVVAQPAPTDGPRRLLFVGRHERRKGLHVLLDVLPSLLTRHPEWICELVGNDAVLVGGHGTLKAEFLARHAGAPWLARVTFAGLVDDEALAACYARASVFVAPSLFESFGLIYLEAMQHGVPVVGSRVGGVPDVVSDGVDGLLVPPSDAAALEAALDQLMGDQYLRARLGSAARRSMAARSHTAMAARFEPEYLAAIVAHHGRRGDASALGDRTVADWALALLDRDETRGLTLACRAAAAFEGGALDRASALVAEALGHGVRSDSYGLALELALARGEVTVTALARRAFEATADASDVALLAVAVLHDADDRGRPAGWDAWWTVHRARLAEQCLAAATAAVRTGRDHGAVRLLTMAAAHATTARQRAQAAFHLGSALKRRGDTAAARRWLETAAAADRLPLLEAPLQGAVHFHLGELALASHDAAAAAIRFEACLACVPGHARARARLAEARPRPTAA